MGYLVLARKYRPQTFAEVSGQEHVVRTLSNALSRGQLAHAFLFTGPRGVGKTTAARLVAKAVNCESGPTAEPCGRCTPCVEIAEGRAVDVVEIDAASNNGVDNVRDIVDAVKYRPARDRYKVFVVDEVHMLSTGAFNALLKTLEEPPEHVLFVLATTDVHKVPETIVSRCQRFDFRRLDLKQIADQLRKVAEAESMKLSDASLALIARSAEGGMRDALSLLDRVRASCGDAPGDAAVAEALGAVDPAAVSRIARALLARDGAALLAEVQSLFDRGLEMKRVAEELVRWLRDVTVAKLAPGVPLDLPEAERREVAAQAQAADAVQLGRLFDLAQRAVTEVKLSEQPRYALEVALLKGALLAPGSDVAALVARVEALAGGPLPAAPPAPPATAAAPAARPADRPLASFGTPGCAGGTATPGAPGEGGDVPAAAPARAGEDAPEAERWRAAVDDLARECPALAPALKQAALLSLGAAEVRVRFAPGSGYPALVERRRADVERAFSAFFGRPVRLAVEVGQVPQAEAGAPIAAVERAEREARSARLREAAQAHPKIQEAARVLGAEIEDIDEV
ncbi:MAG TPA: DNA polymerase III subunit gamma/tau [Anaeromyxobacteraceae bacterium]|nr:DNA polymerase III subunit gamma/tau [Anaeromyxobacteraceae bacterium]